MGDMLNHSNPADTSGSVQSLLAELDATTKQLEAARTRNAQWRAVIEQHLWKGCPSRTLREILAEATSFSDEPS